MKKCSLLIMILLIGCLLCACEKHDVASDRQFAEGKEEVASAEEAKSEKQEAAEQWEKGYDLPVDEQEREEAESDCKKVMGLISDIYHRADKGDASNVVLNDETIHEMQDRIKEKGVFDVKKTLAMVLALVMMFTLLTGCGGGGGDSGGDGTGAEYTWRMALNGSAPGELGYDMATFFKEKVEELTSGRVSIEFYGGNSLGSTTEVLEGMAAGVADITCESVGTLAPFTNLANIDIMPYIYNGYDHFQAVWGGELGQEILDTVGNDSGFKLMGAGYRGARIVTATKEMKTVEDFAGFKLRSPNLEGYIKVWEWMGSAPTPLAMGETYTALQQGTVDGQENSILDSQSYSFQEVCPYWILTNHVYSANTIIMDKAYFESLPEDIQSALEEAAVYAGEQIGQEVLEREDAAKEELTAEGVTFVDVDNAAFTEHFSGYAEANFPDLADWCNQIRALAPNA